MREHSVSQPVLSVHLLVLLLLLLKLVLLLLNVLQRFVLRLYQRVSQRVLCVCVCVTSGLLGCSGIGSGIVTIRISARGVFCKLTDF